MADVRRARKQRARRYYQSDYHAPSDQEMSADDSGGEFDPERDASAWDTDGAKFLGV